MKKIFVMILLAAATLSAAGQNAKDPLWDDDMSFDLGDSNWEVGLTASFMYNYSLNAPAGLSPSGFGMELAPIEMRWNGWKGGTLTVGILDMFFDWQFLQKGNRFSDVVLGRIDPLPDSKGSRFNFGIGFPLGIGQQFSKNFGLSLAVVPGVGLYSYKNTTDSADFHYDENFFPKKDRVHFQLDVKATIWYGDFGIIVRYNPLPAKDIRTTTLSVGISFRS